MAAVRIMYIHTVDLSRKKSRLVTACAGADLNDNVLVIIRVFRKEEDLQLLFQLFHALPGFIQLFLSQLAHFFIGLFLEHGKAVINILLTLFVFVVCFHDRRKVALLFHQLAESLLIIRCSRFLELPHHLFITNQ